jgi:hypothetical protein
MSKTKRTVSVPRGARDTSTAPAVPVITQLPIFTVQTTPLIPTLNALR